MILFKWKKKTIDAYVWYIRAPIEFPNSVVSYARKQMCQM